MSTLDTALLLVATAAFVVAPMLCLIIVGVVDYVQHLKAEAMRKSAHEQQKLQQRIDRLEAEAPDYESWLQDLHYQVDREQNQHELSQF